MNLTREQILNMQPGRELDALVAEKVMGWNPRVDFDLVDDMAEGVARYEHFSMDVRTFAPSTDISAAWEVVEKVPIDIIHPYAGFRLFTGGSFVTVSFDGEEVTAKTAPEAICKAALLSLIQEDTP